MSTSNTNIHGTMYHGSSLGVEEERSAVDVLRRCCPRKAP